MKTAEEAVKRISEIAPNTDVRDNRKMKSGEVAHQGDVYVVRVEKREEVYRLNRLLGTARECGPKTAERQVAIGVTMGSRHIAIGKRLTIYAPAPGASPLEGPTIKANGPWTLEHPEHAHHLFGKGTFVVTFQRDWAEDMRRVAD